MVLAALPAGELIRKLYKIRGKGRNDWPCEALWNSFIASFLFEHPTAEALLRKMCGFETKCVRQKDGSYRIDTAPSASAYSNFLENLRGCHEELSRMLHMMVEYMYEHLEDFGEYLMVDGKAVQSYAKRLSGKKQGDWRGEHGGGGAEKTIRQQGKTVKRLQKR